MKMKMAHKHAVTPWLIRHGKLAEFGQLVHVLIPKTKDMPGKFEDRSNKAL